MCVLGAGVGRFHRKRDTGREEKRPGRVRDKDGETDAEAKTETERSESRGQERSGR